MWVYFVRREDVYTNVGLHRTKHGAAALADMLLSSVGSGTGVMVMNFTKN